MSFNAKSRIFINNVKLEVELGIDISDQAGSTVTPFISANNEIKNYQYIKGALPSELTMKIIFTDEINADKLDLFTEYAKQGTQFYLVSDEPNVNNGLYIFKEYKPSIPYPKFNEINATVVQVATINEDIDLPDDPVDPDNPYESVGENIYSRGIKSLLNLSDLYFVHNLTESNIIILKSFLNLIGCYSGSIDNLYDQSLDNGIKQFLLTKDNCGYTLDKISDIDNLNKRNLECILGNAIEYYNKKK